MKIWHNEFLLFSLLLFCTGCGKKQERQAPRFPVRMDQTIQEDIPQFIKGVGHLVASVEVEIKPQVQGILTNVLFDDGQLVEEGDLLMTIDPRIYEAEVQEAKAQIQENQAKLRYALDFAETYGELVGKEYVARLNYEEAVQNVDSTKAAIELDFAALKKAEVHLDFTQIRAPFKGYVGLRKYDPGNYAYPFEYETLATVRKVVPINVKFSLSSQYVQEIRERQKIEPLYLEAVLPSDPAHPLKGTLFFIDNHVNVQTGMILLEGTIPNEDERGWPGQFTRVYLRLKVIKDAILVPKQAVVLGQTGHFVFVVDKEAMTVEMRMIGKSFDYKDYTVCLWGLKADEYVITDGQLNLYNGAKVFIPEDKKKE